MQNRRKNKLIGKWRILSFFEKKKKKRETPAQTKSTEEISQIKSQRLKLRSMESSISALNCCNDSLKLDKILKEKEKKLARLGKEAKNMKKV